MQEQLGLEDFLAIAEGTLKEPAECWLPPMAISRALSALAAPFETVGGLELYPDPVQRAAICCSRIVSAHLFPHSNSKVAFECMREMLERGGFSWPRPREDAVEIIHMIKALAVGAVGEEEFVSWVCSRVDT